MIVKRYRARSVHKALAQVKAELGENAVILKTYKVPKQGILSCLQPEEVEVVAALEDAVSPADQERGKTTAGRSKGYAERGGLDRFVSFSGVSALTREEGESGDGKRTGIQETEEKPAAARDCTGQRGSVSALPNPLGPLLEKERTALLKSGINPRLAAQLVRTAA
ncbi:MAG: hypothetical protein ONB15_12435, partial [candidate division KSB1 bacterium]|nr:hypothetical protein [candidate division KSB1 bacterium]